MARLEGQRVIITGAAAGIGLAVAKRFRDEGAEVIGVVRKADQCATLEALGVNPLVGDVSQYDTAQRAVETAIDTMGGLDCYIANAGLWDFHKRLEKQSEDELTAAYREIFGVNFLGALFGAHAATAALRKSKGSIIVTGSNACFRAGGGGALYTASKFALRGLVMQLAIEFAPDIRVNGVAPGATDTGISGPSALNQNDRHMNADAARMAKTGEYIPLERVALPEEHTSLYVLLASRDEAPYVTGAMYLSDGGLTVSV